jgi:hypothetical protein
MKDESSPPVLGDELEAQEAQQRLINAAFRNVDKPPPRFDELIHRWNCHDDMLAALKDTLSSLETLGLDGWSDAPCLARIIRAAIAKAEGRG